MKLKDIFDEAYDDNVKPLDYMAMTMIEDVKELIRQFKKEGSFSAKLKLGWIGYDQFTVRLRDKKTGFSDDIHVYGQIEQEDKLATPRYVFTIQNGNDDTRCFDISNKSGRRQLMGAMVSALACLKADKDNGISRRDFAKEIDAPHHRKKRIGLPQFAA